MGAVRREGVSDSVPPTLLQDLYPRMGFATVSMRGTQSCNSVRGTESGTPSRGTTPTLLQDLGRYGFENVVTEWLASGLADDARLDYLEELCGPMLPPEHRAAARLSCTCVDVSQRLCA